MKSKVLNDKNQIAYLLENDLFYVEYKAGVVYDTPEFEFTVDAYVELGKGEIIKVLAIFPEFSNITTEAREFLQRREIPAVAEAIVFTSLAQRIIFRFYQLFRQKKYPVKGFQCKEKALQWLNTY